MKEYYFHYKGFVVSAIAANANQANKRLRKAIFGKKCWRTNQLEEIKKPENEQRKSLSVHQIREKGFQSTEN